MRDFFDALRRELFGEPAPSKTPAEAPTARELRELAITRRQLERLLERGEVDSATFESVDRALEARRVQLLADGRKQAPPAESKPTRTLVEQLESLLQGGDDPRALPPSRRQAALECWRRLSAAEAAALSPPALLALARLLRLAGLTSRALAVYRQFVERPTSPGRAEVALEAARFAAREGLEEEAGRFLEAALAAGPTPETRRDAEDLLHRLRPAPAPPPADAVPVPPEEVREAAPAAAVPAFPALAPLPPRPRQPLTRVLAAFMEERNILWGELVGGLLIVGCSVALVITLWKTLEQLPYFPFLIFTTVTAALFGAGLYTLHHWKLTATSRGLLVITLLLTPLNLLVLAEPSGSQPGGWLELGAKVLALLLFSGLVHTAGRDLLGPADLPAVVDRRWLLVLAVVGAAAVPLLAPSLLPLLLLGLAPAACHVLAVGAVLAGLSRRPRKGEVAAPLLPSQAYALFLFLGASLFAVATALGFLLTRGEAVGEALHTLSIPFALGGAPALSAGLLVYRRTAVSDADGAADGVRTAGTAVGLAGLAVLTAAVALAWPDPAALLAVCVWGGGVLTVVAFRRRLPLAHAAALAFLALGWLIAVLLADGGLSLQAGADGGARLASLLCSSTSAVVLTAFALTAAAVSEGLARWGRRGDAVVYLAAAGAAGLAAVGLATWRGFEEPGRAVLACGLCGGGALAVNGRWRRPFLPYVGLGLSAAAGLWGLWWARSLGLSCGLPGADGSAHGVCGLILAAAALTLAAAAAALGRAGRDTALGQLGRAARDTAAATALLAAVSVAEPTLAEAAVRAATAAALAAAALVLAPLYGRRFVVWVGSAFLLAAFVHLLVGAVGEGRLPCPLAAALLGHVTLALSAGLAVHRVRRGRLFGGPLRQSALLASLAAVPLLLPDGATAARAGYAAWLAILWLAAAWARRSASWFTAFQAALTGAVLLGVTAWLQGRDWVRASALGLADPRALHGYGVALAALGLAWVAARAASPVHRIARRLWPAAGWSLDRVVLGGLVIGQAGLALWGIAPGVAGELVPVRYGGHPGWPAEHVHAYGLGAWVLLGWLAVVLTAEWLRRGRTAITLGLVALALTVPVLAAGPFAAETAAASALRWGTAACFLACAAVLWLRGPLGRWASAAGVTIDPDASTAARRLLVAAAAVLILSLTAAVAALGFAGEQPTGPDVASFFARVGWTASNVVPLALFSLGLAGFAVRERSPGYAFAAGLIADVSLMGGYALAVVTGGGALDAVQGVRILQLGSLGAAFWALGWLLARRWVFAWRETPRPDFVPAASARPLMRVQIGAALAGNALLLAPAVLLLALPAAGRWVWTGEAGSLLGWAALLAGLAAPAVRRGQLGGAIPWAITFLAGAAVLGLAACTIERASPGSGYRALLLGGAGYVLLWAWAPLGGGRQPSWLAWVSVPTFAEASYAVLVLGAAVVALALQGAMILHDSLTASAAVALVAAAVGTTAFGRGSDGLAFLAGLCGNLAATLFAIHVHPNPDPAFLFMDLVPVNVAAWAGAALLWQGVRRHSGGRPAGSGLLTIQALLGLIGHALLLLALFGLLFLTPGAPPSAVFARAGGPGAWFALLLAAAAALWRLGDVQPHARVHVLGLTALSAGVLAACAAAPWDVGDWLSYHALTLVWVSLGFAATAGGSVAFALRTAGLAPGGGPYAEGFATWFPARRVRRWLEGVGLAVAVLALRGGGEDPYRPYSTATAALAVSVMAGALALWSRRAYHVYASGLLFTTAGMLVWSAWGACTAWDFSLTIALCLAAAGAFWAAVDLAMRPVWRLIDDKTALADPSPFAPLSPVQSFPHAAAGLGLGILAGAVALALTADALGAAIPTNDPLAWVTAAALAMGLGVCWWDHRAYLAPAGLYALGLTAVGLGLHSAELRAADLSWSAGLALAGYAASVAALVHAARRAHLGRRLHLPPHPVTWSLPAQAGVAGAAVVLSAWMCVGFDALGARLGGPAAVALLAVGAALSGAPRQAPLTLLLAVLAAAETAAALPNPAGLAAWLDRDVLLLPTLTILAILYGAILPRLAGRAPAWAAWGRRLAPAVGGLAALAVAALVTQEFRLYDPTDGRTPMAAVGVAVVACALVVLAAAAIAAAVRRGRAGYVYAAEVVLALLFVHLRLNVPELFDPAAARYWTLIVLAVAFLGVGLSEFFARRGLRLLAVPLQRTGVFLPLLPLLAFWLRPGAAPYAFADLYAPGLRPFLGYLDASAGAYDRYAQVWLLIAVLYACLAAVRRSPLYALLAALAADCGLWSLLTHYQIAFLVHPQAWLIPLGLILLAAEHLNRPRLRPELALGLRYLGLTLVYVSSTADLFITGVGNSVVLPVVLAVLAVLGALAGVWLRVRAFLFLGVGFLALDVFTMIWHAAVDREQTWVWWASGIVLGAAILTLFAVFEKRRNDILRIVEDVRTWD